MNGDGSRLRISVEGSPSGLGRVVEAFDRFSADRGIPDAARRSVQVVLDELLSNTARCGGRGGRAPAVEVGFRVEGASLTVEVVDDGSPYDPLAREAPDTTLPLEARPVGGLGLLLVRSLVDEITYDGGEGRNRVVFRKRLDA